MLEMRQRSRPGGSSGSYTRVSTEDDELDTVPTLALHRGPKAVPRQKSVLCKNGVYILTRLFEHRSVAISHRSFHLCHPVSINFILSS